MKKLRVLMDRLNLKALWLLGFAIASLSFFVPFAQAASVTVSISVAPSSSAGPVAPVVTWSSTGAAKCTASDGWTGAKPASGTETLPSVSKTTKFSLTCDSPTGPVTLGWTPPTLNTDGTVVSITGYQVMVGASASALARGPLLPPTPTQGVVIQAGPGLQVFALRTQSKINGVDVESVDSTPASKTVVADSAVGSVTLAMAIVPNPPTNLTAQ